MVGTILPIGYGERAQGRQPTSLWIHALGNVTGAVGLGLVLGEIGQLATRARDRPGMTLLALGVTGGVAFLYSLREFGFAALPIPQFKRQVPARWRLELRPRIAAWLYGLELGAGLMTFVVVSTFYVAALWSVFAASPWIGAATMGAFGFGRALPVVLIGLRLERVEQTAVLTQFLSHWEKVVHLVNGLALGFLGSYLLTGMVRVLNRVG
jgi:sulfite exporter TauE/SafE